MELGYITQALSDLQLSSKEGLPQEHHAELYARMAECYHAAKDINRAKVCAEIAKKLGMKKLTMHIIKRIRDKEDPVVPNLTGGSHSEMMNASALMKLKETQEMGRFMVAKDRIKTGDTLVVEAPHVACLLPECFGSHCHHCFKRLVCHMT